MTTISAAERTDLAESYELALMSEGVDPAHVMTIGRRASALTADTVTEPEQIINAYAQAMRELGLNAQTAETVTATVTDAAVNHLGDA